MGPVGLFAVSLWRSTERDGIISESVVFHSFGCPVCFWVLFAVFCFVWFLFGIVTPRLLSNLLMTDRASSAHGTGTKKKTEAQLMKPDLHLKLITEQ